MNLNIFYHFLSAFSRAWKRADLAKGPFFLRTLIPTPSLTTVPYYFPFW
jgi:hypothetical protein